MFELRVHLVSVWAVSEAKAVFPSYLYFLFIVDKFLNRSNRRDAGYFEETRGDWETGLQAVSVWCAASYGIQTTSP